VRDRASGFLGRFAGDGEDLDDLLRGKLAGGASSEIVGKDLLNGPAQGRGGLGTLNQHETIESCGPAQSPTAKLVPFETDVAGDVLIVGALEGKEDDLGALAEPRRRRNGVAKSAKDLLLTFGDRNFGGPAWHGGPPVDRKVAKAG